MYVVNILMHAEVKRVLIIPKATEICRSLISVALGIYEHNADDSLTVVYILVQYSMML